MINDELMSNEELYTFDECYQRKTAHDTTHFVNPANIFNALLEVSFNKYITTSVRDCEIKALRSDSEFFIVNDISTVSNIPYTNCYVPKAEIIGTSVIGDDSILAKSLNLINERFGNPPPPGSSTPYAYNIQATIESSNNLLFNYVEQNSDRCFRYTVDNKVYPSKSYYAVYKKPILTNYIPKAVQAPSYYRDKLADDQLGSYKELLKADNLTASTIGPPSGNIGELAQAFFNYNCTATATNLASFNQEIIKLENSYERLFTMLDEITTDSSYINYLNSFDNNTIAALNTRIYAQKKQLNSLLGFGGANNGRLSDTTLLAQFKIVENSVLILIIITAIFIYNKIRKAR